MLNHFKILARVVSSKGSPSLLKFSTNCMTSKMGMYGTMMSRFQFAGRVVF